MKMWSFFSRDPTKDFAYDIGDKVVGLENKCLWALHEGKRKANGEEVSVFVFDLKNSSETQANVAKAAFKRIKTLRHPNILTYVDGLENDKVLYVVTERVEPLETYLKNNAQNNRQNELAISWGLHQVTKGLSFLNNDCSLIHNNVCLSSIFVNISGEWKLAGVDYMYPATGPDCIPPVKILPMLERYDPPERTEVGKGRKGSEKWSTDMWGLGCLTWEVFNGMLSKASSLKSLGKIPKKLVPNYCELVSANPKSRPNPNKFLENCKSPGGFMDNKFVSSLLFLEEIQIKDQNEKNKFFNSLPPVLDTFPSEVCKHKILPQLMQAFEYGNAGSAVLAPLFKLGKLLDTEEYQKRVVPCVVKLFSSTDRATRVKLLQQLELFVEHLQPAIVNDKIFPNVVQGFMDTNPVVREHTIRSMLHLAPKLNYKNLNEELLKHFARLQSKDDQGGIRANTTICLGKIACHLNPQMRQKVLISAFTRSLKDGFAPSRQAGIVALAATHNLYTLRESASRLLPALCTMTMDPEKSVRDQAFKAIKCFLGKLEKASEDPELIQEMEKDVMTGGGASSSAAGWAGWAVTGMTSLTSKLYKGRSTARQPAVSGANNVAKPASSISKPQSTAKAPVAPSAAPPSDTEDRDTEEEYLDTGDDWNDNEGWDDAEDWGDMEDTAESKDDKTQEANEGDGDGWEDDWGSLEDTTPVEKSSLDLISVKKESSPWGHADFTPVQDSSIQAASSYNWGQDTVSQDDFFSSMISDSKPKTHRSKPMGSATSKPSLASNKPAPKQVSVPAKASFTPQKTSSGDGWGVSDAWEDDGWGGGDEWGALEEDPGLSKAEINKKKREEKRLQRQKELEEKRAARQSGGGALKLGAKKLAKD